MPAQPAHNCRAQHTEVAQAAEVAQEVAIDPELKGTDPKVRTAKRPILNTHATSVHVGGDCSGWLDVG